jgi:uncharacterized damage-inducible protein DinB
VRPPHTAGVTRSLLADAFEHHSWATLRLIDACTALRPDQLAATAAGTFGSIIDTLRHLVGADSSYLWALAGGPEPLDAEEEQLDLSALRAEMERNGPVWQSFLARELDPGQIIVRHREDGSETRTPLGLRLAQVIHHGTDHRSHVATILTTLGIEPPAMDVWDYAISVGRFEETEPTS